MNTIKNSFLLILNSKLGKIISILLGITIIFYLIYTLIIFPSSPLPINIMIPVNTPQDVFKLIDKEHLQTQLIPAQKQQRNKSNFLNRYFQPWNISDNATEFCVTADQKNCSAILGALQEAIKKLQKDPGYDNNYQKHNPQWVNNIDSNMDLNAFPNIHCTTQGANNGCYGIMVDNTALRVLPTGDPSYADFHQAGEGFPFDYLQASAIWLGTPVHVIHRSKDNQWLLIKASGLLGWVRQNKVGFVDNVFMKRWKKQSLTTLTVHKTELAASSEFSKPTVLYLGTLLPLEQVENKPGIPQYYQVLLPIMQKNHTAKIVKVNISGNVLQPWPLPPTPANFARLINGILGMAYGWGDINYDMDCSDTMRSLYTAFAIWLPRNSYSQAHFGGKFFTLPLSQFSMQKRKAIFLQTDPQIKIQKPTPFLTLVSFGGTEKGVGHISIFIGNTKSHQSVIFQSVWGVRINKGSDLNAGRAIIGHAVISQLDLGSNINLADKRLHIRDLWQMPGFNLTFLE